MSFYPSHPCLCCSWDHKNYGGIINVYSEKGEGITLNIYLSDSDKKVIEEQELPEEVLDDEDMIMPDMGGGETSDRMKFFPKEEKLWI